MRCGGGGREEGQSPAGGRVVGTDLRDQEDFKRRVAGAFVQGDSVDWAHLAKLRDEWKCFGCSGGPPCKWYSRARCAGEAKEPPLIEQARDLGALRASRAPTVGHKYNGGDLSWPALVERRPQRTTEIRRPTIRGELLNVDDGRRRLGVGVLRQGLAVGAKRRWWRWVSFSSCFLYFHRDRVLHYGWFRRSRRDWNRR